MRDVLVIQWSRLGDVVQTRPLLCSLKSAVDTRVIFSCDKRYADVAVGFPEIDELLPIDLALHATANKMAAVMYKEMDNIAKQCDRAFQKDAARTAIVLSRSGAAALLPSALGITDIRGYQWSADGLLTPAEILELERSVGAKSNVDVHLSDLWIRMAGMKSLCGKITPIDIAVASYPRENRIGILCDSGDSMRTPPIAWLAKLIRELLKPLHSKIILLGSQRGDQELLIATANSSGSVLDLRGQTNLRELMQCLRTCQLIIGPDTGALHLAGTLGVKTIGLFPPRTRPQLTGVYCEGALSIELLSNWNDETINQIASLTSAHFGQQSDHVSIEPARLWSAHLDESGLRQMPVDQSDLRERGEQSTRQKSTDSESQAIPEPSSSDAVIDLCIIIPECGQHFLTDALIGQLSAWNPKQSIHIVIVSSDVSRARKLPDSDHSLQLLHSERRLTFAEASNLGAQHSRSHWLLFLNNDTEVTADALDTLMHERKPGHLLSPITRYPDGILQNAGVTFDGHCISEVGHGETELNSTSPDALSAIALLIESKAFRDLKGFDEMFKNGYEDLDLSFRAVLTGYKLSVCIDSKIVHYRSSTPGRFDNESDSRKLFMTRWSGHKSPPKKQLPTPTLNVSTPIVILSEEPEVAAGSVLRWMRPLESNHFLQHVDFNWFQCLPQDTINSDVVAQIRNSKCIIVFRPIRNQQILDTVLAGSPGQTLITDCDDLILNRFARGTLRSEQFSDYETAYRQWIESADFNIVATEELAQSIGNVVPTIIAKTAPLTFSKSDSHCDKTHHDIRIGFAGQPAHAIDLGLIIPALEAILEEHENVTFYWWGCRPGNLAYHPQVKQGGPIIKSYAIHLERLRRLSIDIALVPLVNSAVNRARTPLKYFDWSTIGVPGIYSDISPYRQVVQQGVNGLLCAEHSGEWHQAMKIMISEQSLRLEMARKAQQHVEQLARDSRHEWLDALLSPEHFASQSLTKSAMTRHERQSSVA